MVSPIVVKYIFDDFGGLWYHPAMKNEWFIKHLSTQQAQTQHSCDQVQRS
jgi:hypothetical protein